MAGIKRTRKMAKKRVTKRRRSGLKLKSTAKKLFKRVFKMRGGAEKLSDDEVKEIEKPNKEFTGKILRFGYCAFSVKINFGTETDPFEKVVFLQKYAPFFKLKDPQLTSKPKFDGTTRIQNPVNLKQEEQGVTRDDYIDFWQEKNLKTSNLPITDMGFDIGSSITIKHVGNGLGIEDINTDECAWKVEVKRPNNGELVEMYLTDDIMPQKAIDIILAWKNTKENTLKYYLSKRAENAEIPNVYATTAGEHLEPGDYFDNLNKEDRFLKSAVYRAINEEVASDLDVIFKGTNPNATLYLIPVKTYEAPGRDFRYSLFKHNGKEFGFERYSGSVCYIAYVTDSKQNLEKYNIKKNNDTEEINTTGRISLTIDKIKEMDDTQFMLPEHKQMFIDADQILMDPELEQKLDQFKINFNE